MPSEQEAGLSTTAREQDKVVILKQLDRILQNPYFHHSKRYPSFLRFVVTEALAGRTENLKERSLGIEIFGREPDFNTTNDPIVRVTAAEIRKRIAQYYQEPGHEDEMRISLPSGSYIPHFARPTPPPPASPLDAVQQPAEGIEPAVECPPAHPAKSLLPKNLVAITILVALLIGSGLLFHSTPLDDFWQPFVKSEGPVLFCIADQSHFSTITLRDASVPERQNTLNDRMNTVIIDDISPLVNIAGMLQVKGKPYKIKGEGASTLTDLRQGPSVFIGAYDNGWTLRVTAALRYHFANTPDMSQFWIEDHQNPSRRWLLDRSVQQGTGTYKDYAIVARFINPDTDRPAVVAAGLARGGTVAAGEFLVDSRHMNDVANQAPKGWRRKNIEIVLETQVINGRSGPPRVIAVDVW